MTIRAAAIQLCPVDFKPELTLQKAEEYIDKAGKEGVEIAVFPEGYLPGFAEIRLAKQSGSPEKLAEVDQIFVLNESKLNLHPLFHKHMLF